MDSVFALHRRDADLTASDISDTTTMPPDLHEIATRIAVVERALELRIEALEKAIELQAAEYARRLNDLNHEAARILSAQQSSVNREVYTGEYRRIDERVNRLEARGDRAIGRYSILAVIISAAVSVIVGIIVHIMSSTVGR